MSFVDRSKKEIEVRTLEYALGCIMSYWCQRYYGVEWRQGIVEEIDIFCLLASNPRSHIIGSAPFKHDDFAQWLAHRLIEIKNTLGYWVGWYMTDHHSGYSGWVFEPIRGKKDYWEGGQGEPQSHTWQETLEKYKELYPKDFEYGK